SPMKEYPIHGRGGQGVVNVKGLDRNGDVVAAKFSKGDEDLSIISEQGMVVRTPTAEVREIGRASMGDRVMGLNESDKVVEAIVVAQLEEATEAEGPPSAPPPQGAAEALPAGAPPENGETPENPDSTPTTNDE